MRFPHWQFFGSLDDELHSPSRVVEFSTNNTPTHSVHFAQLFKLPDGGAATEVEPTADDSGEHWRFCPRCAHELINEKCKLRCPRCHYFMSCSDFDFAG